MVPLRRLVALIVIARVRFNVQLVMAVLLCVAGLALVFCGFWVAPSGEIDNSVLVAFGEICTFAGALFGVDYSYKLKIMERHDKRLTEHFCLDEFTYSGIAVDNAINNQPPPYACLALQNLAVRLLEPLRLLYGAPIAILSGYRNEKVNRLAGGVVTSQHLKGEAADCYVTDGPEKLLDVLKCSGLVFDQAILYRRKRFLHLSLKINGNNRMQVLVYNKS